MPADLSLPIPQRPLPTTDTLTVALADESFVDIAAYSGGTIRVAMQYAADALPGAVSKAYVRETVARKLMEAKALLPDGYTFEILDAWRPYEVQLHLFSAYCERLRRLAPAATEAEIVQKAREFVSFPDKSKTVSFVHSSGGAVDLTLVDANGNRLPMGTAFEDFSAAAYTSHFERDGMDAEVRQNRRLLHHVMCACGFTNYPAEWWHYDYGDIFWSFYTGNPVLYPSQYDKEEVAADV